ncbi:MAG: hypothetical protein LUI09_06085 [Prevotellaceae bacterium]|nr:hypothetical protein [Prevotellaceae bacterium]
MTNKTFTELYREAKEAPTPLQALVAKAVAATGRTEIMVYRWAMGLSKPCPSDRKALAEAFDADPDTLF